MANSSIHLDVDVYDHFTRKELKLIESALGKVVSTDIKKAKQSWAIAKAIREFLKDHD